MQGKKVVNYFQTKQTKIHKNDHNIKKKITTKKIQNKNCLNIYLLKQEKPYFFQKCEYTLDQCF